MTDDELRLDFDMDEEIDDVPLEEPKEEVEHIEEPEEKMEYPKEPDADEVERHPAPEPMMQTIEVKEFVPIYDVEGITDDEKRLLLESRIGAIIGKSQIPYIPPLVTYRESESTTAPPLKAVVKVDHRCFQEAWDFYRQNAKNPMAVEFFDIVRKFTRNPEEVYTRVVDISLL